MNKKIIFLITSIILATLGINAQDTIRTVRLDEVSVVSSLKEHGTLRQQAASVAHIDMSQQISIGTPDLKGIGTLVPNLFIPDYGSRQTSAIYVRGIGSRIGTPAVGLYMDNVAYYDKSGFDFNMYDVESIEVLRGPQSTLYGRNAMGGIVKVKTFNPFTHQGTYLHAAGSTKNHRSMLGATHYQRVNDRFAFTLGVFSDNNKGFFKNVTTGEKADGMKSAGGKIRTIWKATQKLTFDANVNYEYSDEKAYPYFVISEPSTNPSSSYYVDTNKQPEITANLQNKYRRSMLNASINTEYRMDALTLNSVTAFQNIGDRMFMDQDFSAIDMYQLVQKQRINTLSEELILKNNNNNKWQWLSGLNIFYQWQNVKGPVTFRHDGIQYLNNLINTSANSYMPSIEAGPMKMTFNFTDNILGDELCFDNNFDTPTLGAAFFHQSTLNDLFGVEGLSLTAGIRLDYEKMSMDYSAWYDFAHHYELGGHLSAPTMHMDKDIDMVKGNDYNVSNHDLKGKISQDYLQFLPKATLKYSFGKSNVYAALSHGYRSGGYNVQNISEFMRKQMQADMMKDVRDATLPVLDAQPMVPADAKEKISAIFNQMASDPKIDIEGTCAYKPEYAWNYEVGTHLTTNNGRLMLDLSGFISDVRDLQLSQMSETGLGRIITNAGRSRSIGAEFALTARPTDNLVINASAGYVSAKFKEYSVDGIDCNGNFVPFIPSSTFNLNAAYTFPIGDGFFRAITLGADLSGASMVYWNEYNDSSSGAYGLIGANIRFEMEDFDVTFWGQNLADKRYTTFQFETMGRTLAQFGKPLHIGISANVKF